MWWDTRIGVGETWDRVIETELAAAKCVVVVWSRLSVDSRWVRSEAHEGLERECLVPVIIESAKPPLGFKLVQTTDLTSWQGDASAATAIDVIAGVRRIVGQGTRKELLAAIDSHHKDARAFKERGDAHFRSKNCERAISAYTKAIDLDPKFAFAHLNRGNAHVETKADAHAIADFTKAIEIYPRFQLAYLYRAFVHKRRKD